jgi:hypothetical protein
MNWKDTNWGSESRAAREIGGRYRAWRCDGGPTWSGWITDTYYRVEYFPPRERRDPNWKNIPYPRGLPGTLAEAKRMAEEDHERRLRALAHTTIRYGVESDIRERLSTISRKEVMTDYYAECPACSSKHRTATKHPQIFTCDECDAIYGNCDLAVSGIVRPEMTAEDIPDKQLRYFDFTTDGSQGVCRCPGWYDRNTGYIAQIG